MTIVDKELGRLPYLGHKSGDYVFRLTGTPEAPLTPPMERLRHEGQVPQATPVHIFRLRSGVLAGVVELAISLLAFCPLDVPSAVAAAEAIAVPEELQKIRQARLRQ